MFDWVIHEAEIVSAQGRQVADIGFEGGQVAEIGTIYTKRREEINAAGMVAMPGFIDTQVHFREPGMTHKEDLESGTRCAVMGGVTTIFEMPNTNPTTTTQAALENKLERAAGRAWCDFGFFVGAATDNIDELARLEMLPGTPGVKIFAGSSTGSLLIEDDETLFRVLSNGKRPCPIHSEDEPRLRARKQQYAVGAHVREHPNIRDAEAARLCTERVIAACVATGRPVHVLHISTQDELPLLAEAKAKGLPVTCEATPQHLTLNAELYETLGTLLQMNPPIRDESHRKAIFEAFENDLFDVLGSDHAPHTLEEKAKPYPDSPSGMPGVQTMLPVMLHWAQRGRVSLEKLVRMGCERPAELYGIVNKGHLKEGFDADMVLLDPRREFKVEPNWLQSKCGWSPYEGWTLVGQPQHVWVRGTRVVKDARPERMGQGRAVTYNWK